MTQEEKELLLRDLSARLPYGVFMTNKKLHETFYPLTCEDLNDAMLDDDWDDIPYLRPMSSMTEEELYEVQEILGKGVEIHDVFISIVDSSINTFSYLELQAVFDWLNKHHFDYRGLIEKNIALDCTGLHIYD